MTKEELQIQNEALRQQIAELQMDNQMMMSLFDKGTSVFFNWRNDEKWSVEHVSQSIQRLLGYSDEEFLSGKVLYADCIYKEDLERVIKEVQNAVEQNLEYFEHEPYRLYTKTKEIIWVHDSTLIVRNSDGEVTNFVGYTTDITDIKTKDQQLLQHSRLVQMGEMISMIAHQWRQPLGAISITAANLRTKYMLGTSSSKKEEVIEEFCRGLEQIEDFTQTLSLTIDDFRNFYAPNKEVSTTSINEPLNKALGIVVPLLNEHGIELRLDLQATTQVQMYESEMMQVFVNIIKNAQDNFINKKSSHAYIDVHSSNTEKGVVVEFYDNGGGIDPAIIKKIYEPYFTTKNEKNGTGLGLYMSKMIVEDHHKGRLSVQNYNGGVCFRVVLFSKKIR